MRIKSSVLFLALAALIGIAIPASAQAATAPWYSILDNSGNGYCLDGFPGNVGSDTPSLAVSPSCAATSTEWWWAVDQVSSHLCVGSYCGAAYTIRPAQDIGDCLSQNNAGSAYLTECTGPDGNGNIYQTWIFYQATNTPPEPILTYLIDYGSTAAGNSTTWCLSSNLTAPPGLPKNDGTVYTTKFTTNEYHHWYMNVVPGT